MTLAPKKPRTVVGAIAAGILATAGGVGIAEACSLAQPSWATDRWQLTDEEDTEAPTSAPVISGRARPPSALEGCGEADLSSDPGDCSTIGHVTIVIEEPAEDDRTAPAAMAYRVEIVEGDGLFEEGRPLVIASGKGSESPSLTTVVSQSDLYTRLRLIPVDAGGNEGPPSNTIELEWSEDGCAVVRRHNMGGWALALLVGMTCIAPLRRRRRLAPRRRVAT